MHLTLNGPPASPERLALAGMALRFGLKELAHPATGGTPLLNRIGALPSNTIRGIETNSRDRNDPMPGEGQILQPAHKG